MEQEKHFVHVQPKTREAVEASYRAGCYNRVFLNIPAEDFEKLLPIGAEHKVLTDKNEFYEMANVLRYGQPVGVFSYQEGGLYNAAVSGACPNWDSQARRCGIANNMPEACRQPVPSQTEDRVISAKALIGQNAGLRFLRMVVRASR